METEKKEYKKHGPLYWVIVVAGMTFIVAASINIGEKLGKTVNPETSSENKKTEVKSNSNSNEEKTEVTNLKESDAKKYVDGYKNLFDTLKSSGLSDDIKLGYAISNLAGTSVVTNTSCSAAFTLTDGEYRNDPYYCAGTESSLNSIAYDTVNSEVKKLFGSASTASKENKKGAGWVYSEKVNSYVELESAFGVGSCPEERKTYYEITSATQTGNKVEITLSYLDYKVVNLNCTEENSVSTYKYTINGKENSVKSESEIVNVYKASTNTLPTLTFTFENNALISVK